MIPAPKRIAFVINDLLLGGAQTMVLNIARRLDNQAFAPIIYYLNEYPTNRPWLESKFKEAGLPLRYLGTGGKTGILDATKALASEFKRERPDLVHAHLPDASISALVAAKLSGAGPVILHEHNTHTLYSWKVRLAYIMLRPLSALTLCFSPVIEKELFGSSRVLSVPPEKLDRSSYTILNGIESPQEYAPQTRSRIRASLGIPEDAIVCVSVARLIEWKGQRTLVDAFIEVADGLPSLYLLLVGEGPLMQELRAKADAAGLAARVLMVGGREDVPELLFASDFSSLALVYESGTGETVGISGFEAMAAGLPLIASDYPSVYAHLEPDVSGVVVEPGNVSDLARALERLTTDAAFRRSVGQAGRVRISERFWERLLPVYEGIYKGILGV